MADRQRTRVRPRKVETAPTVEKTPQEQMREMAITVFKMNKTMNAAKNIHDKTRKALFGLMQQHKQEEISAVEQQPDGVVLSVVATIETPTKIEVDLKELQKLVSGELFLKIVTASKTGIEREAGVGISRQVCKDVPGEPNVVVKPAEAKAQVA